MSLPMEAVVLMGAPPRAKVRSCCARSRARMEAFLASTKRAAISPSGGRSREAREILPMIAVRRLLKSCAMPPASSPSCSSVSALRRSALPRARLCRGIARDVEDGPERLADGFARGPPGQSLGFVVQDNDLSLDIGRDNTIADGAEGDGQTFFLGGDLGLEALAFLHIAHHRDVKLLSIDFHLAEGDFKWKADELACASQHKRGVASAFGHFWPGADDRLRVRFAPVGFRNEFCEFLADHFLFAIAEHFFRRGIRRTNHALLVHRDHSIENVLDDRSDPRLDAFELGKLPAHQHETVTV